MTYRASSKSEQKAPATLEQSINEISILRLSPRQIGVDKRQTDIHQLFMKVNTLEYRPTAGGQGVCSIGAAAAMLQCAVSCTQTQWKPIHRSIADLYRARKENNSSVLRIKVKGRGPSANEFFQSLLLSLGWLWHTLPKNVTSAPSLTACF